MKIHLVMVFRRQSRGFGLRPVNRIKHVRDSQGATAGGTQVLESIAVATDTPVLANTFDVETGSTIRGFFLHVEVVNTEATQGVLPNAYLALAKNPGNNITFPNANVIGSNDNKRFVFHQEMVMLQKQSGSNPRVLFHGVIVVPKSYQRMAPNDRINIMIFSPGVDIDFCWQAHYKEFR